MEHENVARIAALVGDNTRSQALLSLMDDRALPAGELARLTNVSPATMSAHLAKLVEGGLLRVESQGKHRYYRLAGPKVASLLETFGTLVRFSDVTVQSKVPGELRFARTCYRHLAGHIAVELNQAAQQRGLWSVAKSNHKEYEVSTVGWRWLETMGIEPGQARRRGFARACLDWSERRDHISGDLGVLLLERFLALKWIARVGDTRAIRVTHRGQEELRRQLGLRIA
jgi:DNA-binding transcriptional ArsR family regulator